MITACFNPRARDGRESNSLTNHGYVLRFNPRARDGREHLKAYVQQMLRVSIHAPVMDANSLNTKTDNTNTVSIHAPVMDAK